MTEARSVGSFFASVDGGRDKGRYFPALPELYKTFVVNGLVEEIDQIDRVLVHAVQKNIRGVQNDAHGDVWVKPMEFL